MGATRGGKGNFVHPSQVDVLNLCGCPSRVHEVADSLRGGIGIEYSDENRPVEGSIGCQPLVDVAITAESYLRLIAIGELRCHSIHAVVDGLSRLLP